MSTPNAGEIITRMAAAEVSWLHGAGDPAGIAISTRVRLARNLVDLAFPTQADDDSQMLAQRRILAACGSLADADRSVHFQLSELSLLQRRVLVERQLISPEHEISEHTRAAVLDRRETWSVMVNEEDHVRLHVTLPGINLTDAWNRATRMDDILANQLQYAYAPDLGYLTACPSNVGTGLRASVMLHLPALALADQMEPIVRAVSQLGMTVRGLFGESSEAVGDLYQISNQGTLGESEERVLERLHATVLEIIAHEQSFRASLTDRAAARLYDKIGRAYGVLCYGYGLSTREALKYLSRVRLGVTLGMFRSLEIETVDDLLIAVLPGHMQVLAGGVLDGVSRGIHRAGLLRRRLSVRGPISVPSPLDPGIGPAATGTAELPLN